MIDDTEDTPPTRRFARIRENAALVGLIALLAWAPFPLGSAVQWGAGLLELLLALCCAAWLAAAWRDPRMLWPRDARLWIALIVALGVVAWALLQAAPIMPASLSHPIWPMTADVLHRPLRGSISINPWRTEGEALKLASAVMTCWLAFCLARRRSVAYRLFDAIVFIVAAYAVYGFVLAYLGIAQAHLVYALPFSPAIVTGPFMLHNSFATFAGLGLIAALARTFNAAGATVVAGRGARRLTVTAMHFLLGRGAIHTGTCLILFAALVASASRGGFVAACAGLAALGALGLAMRGTRARWSAWAVAAAIAPPFLLLVASADRLGDRFAELLDAGEADYIRLALWTAARHMIADAPWTGLGLGTFQDAYPLYATRILPYVIDKAHCDYLEFAAGIGLPAAVAWWLALGWLAVLCIFGAIRRRRDGIFAMTAVATTALVAVHSAVDFSLQVPAVALTEAALLGIGLAQSFRTTRG